MECAGWSEYQQTSDSCKDDDKDGMESGEIDDAERSDTDGDGVVSIKDVSFLIDYLLNGLPSKDETVGVLNFTGADVNRDGDVNIKDLSILIDQLLTTER